MDIASVFTSMSHAKLQQDASVAVLKMAMDTAEGNVDNVDKLLDSSAKLLEQSVNPHLGSKLDITL